MKKIITKSTLLFEINNDMCHNYYYGFWGRVYSPDGRKYKRFSFVLWFDIFDLMEYYNKDYVTQNEIKEYAKDLAYNFTDKISCYENMKGFYTECNNTINHYNEIIRHH